MSQNQRAVLCKIWCMGALPDKDPRLCPGASASPGFHCRGGSGCGRGEERSLTVDPARSGMLQRRRCGEPCSR